MKHFFHPPKKLNLNVCLENHNISIHENQDLDGVFFVFYIHMYIYIYIYIPHSIISSQICGLMKTFFHPPKKLNLSVLGKPQHFHPWKPNLDGVFFLLSLSLSLYIYISQFIIPSQICEWIKLFFIHPKCSILTVSLEKTHPSTKEKKLNWVCIGETTTFPSMNNMKINLRVALKESNISTPQRNSIQVALHCC